MHTHERSDVRTHSSKCARDSRVYLVISILLSEQCICLRAAPLESSPRIASCGGGVKCPLGITCSFYAYICILYAYASERTQNEIVTTGRERPDINTCSSWSAFTAWIPVRVGIRSLTFSTEKCRKIYCERCYDEHLWPGAR